jgi:hypothetical protein
VDDLVNGLSNDWLFDIPSNNIECSIEFSPEELQNTTIIEPELNLDDAWGTQEQYDKYIHQITRQCINYDNFSIINFELCIERDTNSAAPSPVIQGNRIVDLEYVLKWALQLQVDHSKICTCGKLYLWKEKRNGLLSRLFFKCTMCNRIITKSTQEPHEPANCENKQEQAPVNIAAVWGTLSTGNSYSHLYEILSLLEIPCFQFRTFQKIELILGDVMFVL